MHRLWSFLILAGVAFTSAQAKTQTVTTLSTPSTANFGQTVTLTASVSPAGATGEITFYDGAVVLGSAALLNGTASFATTAIGYGERSLTALYGGDSNYALSLSLPAAINVVTKPGGALVPAAGLTASGFDMKPAALADLNHDGNLDLVVTGDNGFTVGPATVWVFLGKGDGTFQAPAAYLSGISSSSAAVADIDMDGNPDLVVAGNSGLTTLIGNGDGTFNTGSTILSATDLSVVRVADINGDGKADLVLLRSATPGVEILLGNGDGTFQINSPVTVALDSVPSDLLVGDFNGDGVPDLAVASPTGNSVTVMIGNGGGTFRAPVVYTSYDAQSLGLGDLNGDGKPDIVVGTLGLPSFDLLLGNGDGTFAPARTTLTVPGPISILTPVQIASLAVCVYDFDGDGNADVVLAGGSTVMLGNGDGTFRSPWFFNMFSANGSLVAGDLNHDGITDIVTTGSPNPLQPYLGKLAPVFTMAANPNPVNVGQNYTLTATSSYPDATGTVTFSQSGVTLGVAPLSNGAATITVTQPFRSIYYIQAVYSGDSKYAATVAPELYLVVQQAVGISLSVSPNPAVPGQLITLTATVSTNVGNAPVAFFDGTTPLNEQTLYSTTAVYKTTLAAGVHQLTALLPAYIGLEQTSATVVENVLASPGGVLLAGPTYETFSTATEALAKDLNGDGLLDLAVLDVGNKQVTVFLGTGTGTFQSPRQNPLAFVPGAMVVAQFTLASPGDLAITDPADDTVAIFFYYNNGFYAPLETLPVGEQPVAIATADFNNDGFADLVTANAGSNNVSLLNTLGASRFQHTVNLAAGRHPDAVVTGDFNNDGNADFAVANRDDNTVMVFCGNGDGTFKVPTVTSVGSGPVALVAGDLNGDGKTDLVAVDGGSNQVTILLGNGDGTFTTSATYAAGTGPSSAILVDLNGDNKLDLAVTATSGLLVLTGNGDGTFSAPVNYPNYAGAPSVASGAFSGDGRMDLVITMPGTRSLAFLVNGTSTTTALSVAPSASAMSQKVTLTAAVSPSGAVGPVAFFDGLTQIGASPVSHGSASFATTLLSSGTHSLSARFVGGSGYGFSASSAVTFRVSPVKSTGLSGPIRQALPFNTPVNLIPGDFNKDGIEDFAFWRSGGDLIVILGNGDGTFHYPPPGTTQAFGGASPVTADFNNDGNTDIAYLESDPALALGDGTGGFTEFGEIYNNPSAFAVSLAAADFNSDGRTDLVQAGPAGTADVMLGIGDGTFQLARSFPAGTNPVLVATGDFNEDGKPDIVVANSMPAAPGSPSSGAVNVLANNGDGTFRAPQPVSIAPQPVSMVVADFNGDGHLDVAVVHAGGANVASILLGKGDGTFAPAVTYPLGATPAQLLTADMDGDGHLDLLVMFTSAAPAFGVLHGIGDGTFAAPVNYPDILPPFAIAVGDVNGDGRLDVILGESEGVSVFLGAPASGDFNGDGHPDLIWQDPVTGTSQVWFMGGTQGTNLLGASALSGPIAWRIVGVADFNGDGHLDVIWRNPVTGTSQVWFLNGAQGTTLIGAAALSGANSWRIVGVADFNGDGHPDLIWQDPATGMSQVWFLGGAQGTTITGSAYLSGANAWRIVGVADLNGDGHPDVIWQDPATGMSQVWFLGGAQGTTITGAAHLSGPNAWRIVAVADLDGDGHPDAIWQDLATGRSEVWFLGGTQGTTLLGAATLSGPNTWRITE